jgi:hypothetical protein
MRLRRFYEVLEQYQNSLSSATYWRYRTGKLPKPLQFVYEHPDLAMALAEDAAEEKESSKPRNRDTGRGNP